VQDRIIAASNQRCAQYKKMVRQFAKNANFALGIISVSSSALASVLEHEQTAREFSGLSTVSTGIRADFNEVHIRETTKQLFTRGFELRRKEILEQIEEDRKQDTEHYTVERAVADAIKYHDACNMGTGLEHLSRLSSSKD